MLAKVHTAAVVGLEGPIAVGELSPGGSLRHMRGVLPMAALARARGFARLFVPAVDAPEAGLIPELEVYPVETLSQLVNHLSGVIRPEPYQRRPLELGEAQPAEGFEEINGQEHAKRALEVAAAGGHNRLIL